jgi:ribonuclease HI
LHVDGSQVRESGGVSQATGWAFVACHDGEYHERSGAILEGRRGKLVGYHEQLAVVHGLLYAHSQGIAFEDVTLYSDDIDCGYAPTFLFPGNFRVTHADRVRERLSWVVKHCFEPHVTNLVLDAYSKAIVHKVKGHSFSVYQERADYLAKTAAWAACKGTVTEPVPYDDWLSRGFKFFDGKLGEFSTRYAPFVSSESDSDTAVSLASA